MTAAHAWREPRGQWSESPGRSLGGKGPHGHAPPSDGWARGRDARCGPGGDAAHLRGTQAEGQQGEAYCREERKGKRIERLEGALHIDFKGLAVVVQALVADGVRQGMKMRISRFRWRDVDMQASLVRSSEMAVQQRDQQLRHYYQQ